MFRDIKPENIFLTAAQKFKLGDFGLAIRADEELPFTRSGTLDYMAPEVSTAAYFALPPGGSAPRSSTTHGSMRSTWVRDCRS